MQIVSPQFGPLDIDESTAITFPDGMPGFETCTRFKLLHEDVPSPKVLWLQSLDDPSLVFSVVDANLLGLNYQLALSDEEAATIGPGNSDDIVLLLTLAKDKLAGRIKPNTFSPIVLNTATQRAIQKGGVRAEIIFTNT
ncbi:flagellar assembly protein FliW [Chitinimonas sp.]|uniref:flagellar assembly protein FliW n=1 Tax=Chitinimonas sp. TaxID=1934313 RepID=UPI0035B08966